MILIGHLMVVILLLRLLTSYIDATRCLWAISACCASYGQLCFCHMAILCLSLTMTSFAKPSIRHPSEELPGKVLNSLTVDRDPMMCLCEWKMNMKSGIGTPAYSSRTYWQILSFRTSLTMHHFNSSMPMVTTSMKTLCQAIGHGTRP
jgi:hypothetical protein